MIGEPASPLWTAVKGVCDSWPGGSATTLAGAELQGKFLAGGWAVASATGSPTTGLDAEAGVMGGATAEVRAAADHDGVGVGVVAGGSVGLGIGAEAKIGENADGRFEIGGANRIVPGMGPTVGFDLQIDQHKVVQSTEHTIHEAGQVAGEVGSGVRKVIDWL